MAAKFLKDHSKDYRFFLSKMTFFALCDPFGHKNSGNQRNLNPKAIKAKKAAIRQKSFQIEFSDF